MLDRVILVDISSFMFRAFHALPNLRTSKGMPTGAIQGVVNMLNSVDQLYPTAYKACIFDSKSAREKRTQIYAEYKANRTETPDDLLQQFDSIKTVISALGWISLLEEGHEADDVIGSIVVQLQKNYSVDELEIIIATGDKDFAQLVDSQVKLLDTMKSSELIGELQVIEKFGIRPNQIIDYLALIGDKSDNVPGVEKVGPVTAVKWLNEFDSLENLIKNASNIKGKVGENLRSAIDSNLLNMSKQLVTIDLAVHLGENFNLESLRANDIQYQQLIDLYTKFEFKQLLAKIKKQSASFNFDNPDDMFGQTDLLGSSEIQIQELKSEAEINTLIEDIKRSKQLIFKLKTHPELNFIENTIDIFNIQIQEIELFNHKNYKINDIQKVKCLFEDESIQKISFDLKSIQHALKSQDIDFKDKNPMDLMLLSKLLRFQANHQAIANYATHEYLEEFEKIIKNQEVKALYCLIEQPVIHVLFEMERFGALIDKQYLIDYSKDLGEELSQIEQTAYAMMNQEFNLNSPKQIQEILFDQLKLPVIKKTAKGVPSTDEKVLQELQHQHELPKLLLTHRTLSKLKQTYADKLPEMTNPKTHRIHTHYEQIGAITGRLASRQPNLQNLPVKTAEGRKIREAFIASKNHVLLSADYSQIELRIMAHLSQDELLLKSFKNQEDIHKATASEILNKPIEDINSQDRRIAKVINFGLIYGMSAFGVSQNLNISPKEAQNYIDQYFSRYVGVKNYMEQTRQFARDHGFVQTIFGRTLYLPDIHSKNYHIRQESERMAINAPMQGSSADIIKLAMKDIQNYIENHKLKTKLILQIHDELVLEIPNDELELMKIQIIALMENTTELTVPLIAEFKENY